MVQIRYCLLLFFWSSLSVSAQTLPVLDQNPPRLRWYQLRTPHFRILYPDGFQQPAQHTARRLEQVYGPVSQSLEREPRHISIILQNQTTVNNGFVTLIPRRAEFFGTPPQDPFLGGTLDWLDLLSVHEFRHVVQYDKALQGFSRAIYTVFGYPTLAGLTIGVPDWFWEGDAVGTETALTYGGRGRIPNFDMGYRANLLADKRFTYQKAVGGSYRDNVPNHYVLGYFMTTYLKRTYGANAWSQVLNRYYRFPLYPFSFSNAIKKTTGYRVEELYRRSLADIDETWRKQQEALKLTAATDFKVNARETIFTNYQYPQYLSSHEVVAIKSGLGDISQVVLLDTAGTEKKVFVQGLFNDPEMLSAAAGKVCWTEFRYDPRFGQRIYSEIKLLDLKTGRLTRLTKNSRYAVASVSPDGTKLVAVRNDASYQTRLVILDARTGQELRVLDNPDNDFFLHPRWRADNRTLVVVTRKGIQKAIQLIDSQTGDRKDLLPLRNENISHPLAWQQYVFYNSPRSGIDNIYAVDTETGRTYQVTSRPLGAYHASVSPDGRQLSFHDFRANGYRVVAMPLVPTQWTPVEAVNDQTVRYFGPLVRQEPGGAQVRAALSDSLAPAPDFAVSRFSRLKNAINIYGWGPLLSSNGQGLTVGLRSQDLLSTTQVEGGYTYNQAERAGGYYVNLSYQGWFPVIDVGLQGGRRNTSLYIDRYRPLDSLRSDSWHYDQLRAGVRLPLRLTRSKYQQSLSLGAYYIYQRVTGYDLPVRPIGEVGFGKSLSAMSYSLAYSRLLKQSKRDVAPRWGQSLSAVWYNTPFGGALNGELWAVQGNLFLPGLGKHHSLRFRGGYQQQAQGSYRFGSGLVFPRGYSYVIYDRLTTGTVEYRMPLADPHWFVGRWLYIQRIKANAFYDGARGVSRVAGTGGEQNRTNMFYSAGLDVSFVFNFMRLRTPLEAGIRTVYNGSSGLWQAQLLVIDIGF